MQNDNSKVYFKKLTTDEKLSKIFQLSRHARAEIVFWKKGSLVEFTVKGEDLFLIKKKGQALIPYI